MKFAVASDLHIERGPIPLFNNDEGADCLLLAGDITELRLLKKSGSEYSYIREFFEHVSKQFPVVLWVSGNHESYGCYYMQKAVDDAKEKLAEWNLLNVNLVENQTVWVGNVPVHCTTLWTDFNRKNPVITMSVQDQMNDYKYIRGATPKRAGSKINTSEVYLMNQKSKEFLRNAVSDGKDCVIMTHHQPLMELLDSTYQTDLDYAYANTDLQGFLYENENIKVWVAGHTHQQFDVSFGDQRFVTNCRGYSGAEYELNLKFKLKYFDITQKV